MRQKEIKLKEKPCRCCKKKFLPSRLLQIVCSPGCAYGLVIKNKEKEKKSELKRWNKEYRQRKDEQKTKPDYEKDLEREVNAIVRLLDKGHPCISSGAEKYIVNAGHLRSVKAFPELRYNLLNIFAQRVHDNQYIGGNPIEYREGLKKTFGYEVYEEIECLPAKYKSLDLSIEELKEKIKTTRKVVRELKKKTEGEAKPFTTSERIELRRYYNNILGIYV